MTYAQNISELIGGTPLVKLQALSADSGATTSASSSRSTRAAA